jgi:Flp pilus assembly protein TadD
MTVSVLCIPAFGQTTEEDWFNKGIALEDLGKYDEAIQAFDKALELDPQNAEAWSEKGYALGELGKYDEAIQALDKAIELDPQNAEAWSEKGVVLELLNKTTGADAAYASANELSNTGPALPSLGSEGAKLLSTIQAQPRF